MGTREGEAAALIRRLEQKYFWWRPESGDSFGDDRVIAQVMNLGTHDDAEEMRNVLGDARLASALRASEAGWLSDKSWHYWHYALGLARVGEVPAAPRRTSM